ncbi:MAG: hypothetical protein ABIS67_14600 [Candidatus Eisenbacteria bacterium]
MDDARLPKTRPRIPATAARARLLEGFARDTGGAESMTSSRRALRTKLAAAVPHGPLGALSAGAECAARLRGLSVVLRGLVHSAPVPARADSPARPNLPAGTLEAVRTAAVARDVAALDGALSAEIVSWEQGLRDRAAVLDARESSLLWSGWRDLLESRAAEFEFLAAEREAAEPVGMRARIPAHAALRALTLEPRVPDPSPVLAAFPAEPAEVVLRPVRNFWAGVALIGALAGLALFAAGRARRRERNGAAGLASPAADPGDGSVWLHVVTGGDRKSIARAVCELAAHPLARRQRVVVVDASRHLRLDQVLRLSPRLGFVECLTRGLPALGVLQSGGFTGLFLLARGGRARVTQWLLLDRLLEELRPHFSRVILAFDESIPTVVGGVLAGRWFRAWWAGPGPAARRAGSRAAARLAITLTDLELGPVPKASLEALEARLVSLAGVVSLAPAPCQPSADVPVVFRVSPPAVLECDLQIRQKLRFLAWMRKMRAERQGSETAGRP